MIVVSDTTAITSLLKIHQAEVLQRLFVEIAVPEAVRNELLKYHSAVPQFLQVRAIRDTTSLPRLLSVLDRGEAEAIVLAKEIGADALLIDEKLGRSFAEQECCGGPTASRSGTSHESGDCRRHKLRPVAG